MYDVIGVIQTPKSTLSISLRLIRNNLCEIASTAKFAVLVQRALEALPGQHPQGIFECAHIAFLVGLIRCCLEAETRSGAELIKGPINDIRVETR
jgi:hypothetical protein